MKIILCLALVVTMLSVVANCQQPVPAESPECSSGTESHIEPELLTLQTAQVPDYPPLARQARITGKINLLVRVKHGQVTCVTVMRSDASILANAAKRNVESWRFAEGTGHFEVSYIYELAREETILPEIPCRNGHSALDQNNCQAHKAVMSRLRA